MQLPTLTPRQYLTLHLLFAGPQTGQQLRAALRALDVRQSAAAFSRLMMRLIAANRVVSRSSLSTVADQPVRQNLYLITDLGLLDWIAAQKFYLNLAPPSSDLVPVPTDAGELAAYDDKTRLAAGKARLGNAFKHYILAALDNLR
jgi:hypothetical protein